MLNGDIQYGCLPVSLADEQKSNKQTVPEGRICSDSAATLTQKLQIKLAVSFFNFMTDTRPTSPSSDLLTLGV